jgi:hypothetical protein
VSTAQKEGSGLGGALSQKEGCASANTANFVGSNSKGVRSKLIKCLWPFPCGLNGIYMKSGAGRMLFNKLNQISDGIQPAQFVVGPLDGYKYDFVIKERLQALWLNQPSRINGNRFNLKPFPAKGKGGLSHSRVFGSTEKNFLSLVWSLESPRQPLDTQMVCFGTSPCENK